MNFLLASAAGSGKSPFMEIVTKPDNIPIVGMIFIVAAMTWWGLSQALRHDRHLENGEPEKVIDEMIK